ncbi:MAG: PKD domain-containing protein, partial [Bacteroidetes bacterium]|nr:PKD domain-containing protein [Bacteroidota bacterium]
MDISSYSGSSVYIAFHYESTGITSGTSTTWEVDNIRVTGDSFGPPPAITIDPLNATAYDEITLTFNTYYSCTSSGSLVGIPNISLHSGVTIGGSTWQYAVNWDETGSNGQSTLLTNNGDGTHSITFIPYEFYGFPEGTVVEEICAVFNSGSWNEEGKDHDPNGGCRDFFIPLEQDLPPIAYFSSDKTILYANGGDINFIDESINSPTSWNWTFEGGTPSTSTDQDPTVYYDTTGKYDVTLEVTNADGSNTVLKTDYIYVAPYQEDWSQGWEFGIEDWWVSDGTWEVGVPTSGPNIAHTGSNCAATVLDGNYSDYADDSYLVSPWFTVPSSSENPRLRFWHWYDFNTSGGDNYDFGKVQIRTQNNPVWVDISNKFSGNSSTSWINAQIDLTDYADSLIQIGFYFHSQVYVSPNESSGWYIDDIELRTGPIIFNNPEDWETGVNDWWVSDGTWEVGVPTSGPGGAYGGSNCAATVLDGNYSDYADDSYLVSPWFTVPSSSENPRLRFWHWYDFNTSGGDNYDFGKVQIRTQNNPVWVDISNKFSGNSSTSWINAQIDLTDYADSLIQIGFYFHSQVYVSPNESSGWYIDDI